MKITLNDLLNAKGVSEPLQGAVKALIDRLEAAEKERRALRAALQHETDCVEAAKAEIAAMNQQEPVGYVASLFDESVIRINNFDRASPVYLAPGAQPAPSIPEGWKLVPIEPTPVMKTAGIGVEVYQDSPPSTDCLTWGEVEAIYSAMIAAAPKVKP